MRSRSTPTSPSRRCSGSRPTRRGSAARSGSCGASTACAVRRAALLHRRDGCATRRPTEQARIWWNGIGATRRGAQPRLACARARLLDDPARGEPALEQQLTYYDESLAWAEAAEDGRPHEGARAALGGLRAETTRVGPRRWRPPGATRASRTRCTATARWSRCSTGRWSRSVTRASTSGWWLFCDEVLTTGCGLRTSSWVPVARGDRGTLGGAHRARAATTCTGSSSSPALRFTVSCCGCGHCSRAWAIARVVRLRQCDQHTPSIGCSGSDQGVMPMRATGSAGAWRRSSARSSECSSTLRISRGSMSSSKPKRLRRAVRRLDLLRRAASRPRRRRSRATGSSPPRPSRPSSRRGTRTPPTARRSAIMPITIEPKP